MISPSDLIRPEPVWPVDPEFADSYEQMVRVGRGTAKDQDVVVVSIARNAKPYLANTCLLVDELRQGFKSLRWFVYENDSSDGTGEFLDMFASGREWVTVERETLGVPDERGFQKSRTERLAGCRNRCLEWVRQNAVSTAWVIVLDVDPQQGFSVDGVFNSIGWLCHKQTQPSVTKPGGMASYSLYAVKDEDGGPVPRIAHYDAWAARPNWWRDRKDEIGMAWFSMLLYPVGAPPVPFNSAFGGLCVYATKAFLSGGYSGEDCEHVPHHRRMRDAGYQLYLNPGSRYIAIWET